MQDKPIPGACVPHGTGGQDTRFPAVPRSEKDNLCDTPFGSQGKGEVFQVRGIPNGIRITAKRMAGKRKRRKIKWKQDGS